MRAKGIEFTIDKITGVADATIFCLYYNKEFVSLDARHAHKARWPKQPDAAAKKAAQEAKDHVSGACSFCGLVFDKKLALRTQELPQVQEAGVDLV